MTQEECPFRSSRVLHDDKGDFHLCNREEGDCECIPRGCPYLIAKNSKLNLPDLPGYVQINNKEGEKSEIPTSLEETAEISFDEARALTEDYRDFLAKGLTENRPRPIGPHWFCEYAKNRFIAGAEWQKEQMMKKAVVSEIGITSGGILLRDLRIEDFDYEDKAKIIIVKGDDRPRD